MKIYLAAPYSMKDIIAERAWELREMGIAVTSSWIKEPHAPTTQMQDLTHDEHQAYAMQDVADVAAADCIIFHTDPTKTIVRAGRHVEFGIAIGIGLNRKMPILVVGEDYENIFHHLPQVRHFTTWGAVKGALPWVALELDR